MDKSQIEDIKLGDVVKHSELSGEFAVVSLGVSDKGILYTSQILDDTEGSEKLAGVGTNSVEDITRSNRDSWEIGRVAIGIANFFYYEDNDMTLTEYACDIEQQLLEQDI